MPIMLFIAPLIIFHIYTLCFTWTLQEGYKNFNSDFEFFYSSISSSIQMHLKVSHTTLLFILFFGCFSTMIISLLRHGDIDQLVILLHFVIS
jgi:hypothetical protein